MQLDFKTFNKMPAAREEQETIITYDKLTDEWHFYTDNPVHARKYEAVIVPSGNYTSSKSYHAESNQLIGLEGKINGSVSIRKKTEFSDERKKELSDRMKELHESGAMV